MPLYEYECPEGHRAELIRPTEKRNENINCPFCGAESERVPSAPATPVLNPARPVKPRKGGFR